MLGTQTEITEQQIAFYRENGYLQIPDFFSPEETREIKRRMLTAIEIHRREAASIAEMLDGKRDASMAVDNPAAERGVSLEEQRRTAQMYAKVFDQRVNLWKVDPAMREVVFDPRMAEAARQISGFRALRLWHDQALIKPGGDSRPSNWHQDTVYWPMQQNGGFSIWIALDDVNDDNGCMWFIPKSRDLGRLDPQILTKDDPESLLKQPELQGKLAERVCMAMPAGGVTFHDGLTFHYANANRTDKPRHAFVVIYMPDGTIYNGNSHICTDGKGITPGEPIAGEDFPILAQE